MSVFFVGSYTQMLIPEIIGKGSGIYTVQLNDETGELSILHTLKTVNPSYLVISEDGQFLYCNTEVDAAFHPKVQAYKINEDFSLEFLNEQPIPGGFPCYIEKHKNNILVACYQTGNIIHYTLSESGKLQPYAKNHQHFGSSINKDRQESPHAHQVTVHPNKNQVFACDLGTDTIKAYHFKKEVFLTDKQNDIVITKGGGPRHLVFNKNGKYAYAINELSGAISVLKNNENKFKEINTYSTLPSTYTNVPSASAIRIHPNQQFLYAANRTLDAITIFRINEDKLEVVDYHYTNGKELREFNLTPNGKWLIACHQNSDDTIVYQIKLDGKLAEKYRTQDLKTPVCVVF
ncbi:MAG: lactonase family protein [Cellulophaga sp.]